MDGLTSSFGGFVFLGGDGQKNNQVLLGFIRFYWVLRFSCFLLPIVCLSV